MAVASYEGLTLAQLEELQTATFTSIKNTLKGQKKDMEGRMLEMPELDQLNATMQAINAAIAKLNGTGGAKIQRGIPVMNR